MSVLNYGVTNKQEADLFADKLISEVKDGQVNPLELHVKLTALQRALDKVKKEIVPMTIKEAEKYSSRNFSAYNSKLEISELGVKYDYSGCGDAEWEHYKQIEESAAASRKGREEFLKAIKGETEIMNSLTSEMIKVSPPVKSSTTGLKVTLL